MDETRKPLETPEGKTGKGTELRDSLVSRMKKNTGALVSEPGENPEPWSEPIPGTKGGGFMKNLEIVKRKHLVLFTEELTMLMEMGVPVFRALQLISRRTASLKMRRVAADLVEQIQKGTSLAKALHTHPTVFSRYYVKSVQAGEESGNMVQALKILSSYLSREESLNTRVRSTMVYPLITSGLALVVLGFLFMYVIPTFAQVYLDYKLPLPLPTQIVYSVSLFIQKFLWLIIFLAAIAVGLLVVQARYNVIEDLPTRILLRIPLVHGVMQKIVVYRFSRTMAMLLGSGVNLLASLRLSTEIIAVKHITHGLETVALGLEQGETMSTGLRHVRIFPDFVVDMISIGEEAGSLHRVFDRLANTLESEVNTFFETITNLLEPAMTLFVGVLVLIVAAALFMPYFSMGNLFQIH